MKSFKELRNPYKGKSERDLKRKLASFESQLQDLIKKSKGRQRTEIEGEIRDMETKVQQVKAALKEDVNEAKYKGKFPPDMVAAAVKIAMSMSGDMTGATKKIEAMKRGLSKDKVVADTLRLVNEDVNEAVSGVRGKDGKVYKIDISKTGKKIEFRVVNQFGDIKTLNLKQAAKLFEEQDLEKLQEARRKKPKPSARDRLIKSLKKNGYDVHARAKAADAEVARLKKLYNMESTEEMIELGEFTIPVSLATKIPFLKDKVYQKALRYYLDWRKKNPKQGSMGISKAAREFGVDIKTLQSQLHKLIDLGKLPKHLATNPNMLGGHGKITPAMPRGGFLQQ
jgi:hypothetical protein